MNEFRHYLLTPFNVKRELTGRNGAATSRDWLENRIDLFMIYCFPSVIAQSNKNFEWLIFFDRDTDADLLARIEIKISSYSFIKIIFCDFWTSEMILENIPVDLDAWQWLITTRIDNDDAIHSSFVDIIQRNFSQKREFINFENGVIAAGNRFYRYVHPSNAFLTFVEPRFDARTVFSCNHEKAAEVASVRQVREIFGFCQVVHGGNVSNKIRGRRIPRSAALSAFPILEAATSRLSFEYARILGENISLTFCRKVRDLIWRRMKFMFSS